VLAWPYGLKEIGTVTAAATETLVTRAGVVLLVREAMPADAATLGRLYSAMTPEDRRARFLGTMAGVDEARVRALLEGQGQAGITFLATTEDGEPLATATLAPCDDGSTGEVAIAVRSDCKEQGIGWTMLDHVRRHASAMGLLSLCSIESGDNRAALDLERDAGFRLVRTNDEGGEVLAITSLADNAPITPHG
jgi:L-amino acid N-acyltransferase YncA